MNSLINKRSLESSYKLGISAFLVLLSVWICHLSLENRIISQKNKQLIASFKEIAPDAVFDDNFLSSSKKENLGEYSAEIFQTQNMDAEKITFIRSTTNKGYSGDIKVLIGIKNCNIIGARVLEHKETPGLGDKIELRISDWILNFNNKNLQNTKFAIKKDGGDFDSFTGATITPRAVTNLIGSILKSWENCAKDP